MQLLSPELTLLYQEHVTQLFASHQALLKKYEFEYAVIPAGELKYAFQDDMTYPFKSNAYFKWLVPLTNHPNCFIVIPQNGVPTLIYYMPKDYWHAVPSLPDAELFHQFDIQIVSKAPEAMGLLPHISKRIAWLGEKPSAFELSTNNEILPEPLLSELHWLRATKTGYEKACLYQASLLGTKAHLSAKQAFYTGCSEIDIHNAYVKSIGCKESELPYTNIVALNEHAAILHYTEMNTQCFPENDLRSFLIDAGGSFNGYASDITRTYAFKENAFANMIELMDEKQLEIISAVEIGMSYLDLHKLSHHKIAEVLVEFDLINVSAEDAVEAQLTSTFLPHGLGHHLGLHVHDAGGHQETPTGGVKLPPAPHNFLRNTRVIEAGNYLTIEPGLYFIPQLLENLKAGDHAIAINWSEIEKFIPFGGIRIEDNIFVNDKNVENFTRMAFEEHLLNNLH